MSAASYIDLPSPDLIAKHCDEFCCSYGESCWHKAYIRHYAHMFGDFPRPRVGWTPPPEKPDPPKTKQQIQEEKRENEMLIPIWELVRQRRADEWWAAWERRYRGVPARLMNVPAICWRGGGGGGSVVDIDAMGSWGRHVRTWEDRDDER